MLVVRFPNGQKLTFNSAHRLQYKADGIWELYEDAQHNRWVASIQPSAGAIVEDMAPCRVENENLELTERRAFEIVERVFSESRHGEGCGDVTASIKRHLRRFNAQTWMWR